MLICFKTDAHRGRHHKLLLFATYRFAHLSLPSKIQYCESVPQLEHWTHSVSHQHTHAHTQKGPLNFNQTLRRALREALRIGVCCLLTKYYDDKQMQQSSEVLFGSQPNPVSLSFGSQHSPIPTPAVRCATELSFVCVNETVIFSSHKGGYNPAHSTTSADALTDFLNSSVQEDLVSIPGIGEVNKAILVADMNSHNLPVESIQTTFQLIAKFLSLKGPGVTSVEHCDRFYYW